MNAMTQPPRKGIRELDVRPLLAAGKAPMGAILSAVQGLGPDESLRLVAPFEPVPLYAKLGDLGFDHVATGRGDGTFEVLFTRRAPALPGPILLDLRNLEPPQPMQRVLEALNGLAPGGALIALTRFRPVHLLELLEERGLAWETTEQADGSWETIISSDPSGPALNPSTETTP